jgi:hypothetical protein
MNNFRSLDAEEDPNAERLWIEEAERRYREYKEGRVKAKPAEAVFKEARDCRGIRSLILLFKSALRSS